MIEPADEGPRPAAGEGFTDAVAFAFAEPEQELYGLAGVGFAPQERRASALAVLFAGAEVAAAQAEGGVELEGASWEDVAVAGVRARTVEPLAAWRVEFDGDDAGFALEFSAVSPPLEFRGEDVEAAQASGVEGYEQLCRVEGEATVGSSPREVHCLGQRGHGWGPAPWDRIALARTVSAWLDGPRGLALSAVRPAGAEAHGEEAVTAFLIEPADDGPAAARVAEPRLSTTYDSGGRQRRAGLELWMSEDDDLPRRMAGEVVCGTSLELGRLRLDCAFFRWSMEGLAGAGRYDVLRRA
jgi:hypothetical protein